MRRRHPIGLVLLSIVLLAAAYVAHADGLMGSLGKVGGMGSPAGGEPPTPGGGYALLTESNSMLTTESNSILQTENAP